MDLTDSDSLYFPQSNEPCGLLSEVNDILPASPTFSTGQFGNNFLMECTADSYMLRTDENGDIITEPPTTLIDINTDQINGLVDLEWNFLPNYAVCSNTITQSKSFLMNSSNINHNTNNNNNNNNNSAYLNNYNPYDTQWIYSTAMQNRNNHIENGNNNNNLLMIENNELFQPISHHLHDLQYYHNHDHHHHHQLHLSNHFNNNNNINKNNNHSDHCSLLSTTKTEDCYTDEYSCSIVNNDNIVYPKTTIRLNKTIKYNDNNSNDKKRQMKRKPRYLSENSILDMEKWYLLHEDDPYPSAEEKKEFAKRGNITISQVNSWFANRRNRCQNTRPKKKRMLLQNDMQEFAEEVESLSGHYLNADEVYEKLLDIVLKYF